jgi:hypothetical protein
VTSISSSTASPGAETLPEDTVDLDFLGCRHASYLNLRDLIDPVEIPEHDATTILIFKKGIEHEKRHLPSLKGTING